MAELEKRIELWKSELLDTGKRNKMINYKDTKLTTLKITEPGAGELFEKIAVHDKTLKFMRRIDRDADIRVSAMLSLLESLSYRLVVEEGDIRSDTTELERNKALKNLRAKAKLAQEEQGTNILYLSFGFIYWREKSSGQWMRSPLLLVPVTIGQTSLKAPYTLSRFDDDIAVNPTLDYKFTSEYNITLPAFDAVKDSFDEYMNRVESLVDKNGWRLAKNEVSLGLLSFLKISMYHDLDEHRDLILKHPVLQTLAGDRSAAEDIPEPIRNIRFDDIHPKNWHEVINADSSQEEAILLSKAGVSFVMQGPPGTGKSQTITNIIAEALADGKKVLFVSEKAAALQVVLKRLTEADLSDFCLSLHNYKANKRDIIQNIGKNLYLQAETKPVPLSSLVHLMENKKFINAYADELHKIIEPFGQSIYMAYGRLSRYANSSYINFSVPGIESLTGDQYGSLVHYVTDFENALKHLGTAITENPWYDTTTGIGNQAYYNNLMAQTNGLDVELQVIASLADGLKTDLGLNFDNIWLNAQKVAQELSEVLGIGAFPEDWVIAHQRKRLIDLASDKQQMLRDYRKVLEELRLTYTDAIFEQDVHKWFDQAQSIIEIYADYDFAPGISPECVLNYALENYDTCHSLSERLEQINGEYLSICNALGFADDITFETLMTVQRLLKIITGKPGHIRPEWFDRYTIANVGAQLEQTELHAARIKQAERELFQHWNRAVLNADVDAIRALILDPFNGNDSCSLKALASGSVEKATQALNALQSLAEDYRCASALLKIDIKSGFDDVLRVSKILLQLTRTTYIRREWLDCRLSSKISANIDTCVKHAKNIDLIRQLVLGDWNEAIFDIDLEPIMTRFRTQYTTRFMVTMHRYLEDIHFMRQYARPGIGDLSDGAIFDGLEALRKLSAEEKHFGKTADKLAPRTQIDIDCDWIVARTKITADDEKYYQQIEEAEQHARIYLEGKNSLTANWLEDIWSLDVDGMLSRFEKDYRSFLAHVFNGRYKADINAICRCMRAAGPLPDDNGIIALLRRIKTIKAEKEWLESHAGSLSELIGGDYNGADTNWQTVKAEWKANFDAALEELQEAEESGKRIKQLTTSILNTWDSSLLSSDWKPIAERFAREYTYAFGNVAQDYKTYSFRNIVKEYQADEECLRRLSKKQSITISIETVSALNLQLEQIKEEEKWFTANETRLNSCFGTEFAVHYSDPADLTELQTNIRAAIEIAGSFPYGNIPQETIDAIGLIVANLQMSAESRRLADALSVDKIARLIETVSSLPFIGSDIKTAAIDQIILQIQKYIDSTSERSALIELLAKLRVGNEEITYGDVDQLVSTIEKLKTGRSWFGKNQGIDVQLLGADYASADSDWAMLRSGVEYVKSILAECGDHRICEGLITLACEGLSGEKQRSLVTLLETNTEELKAKIEKLIEWPETVTVAKVIASLSEIDGKTHELRGLVQTINAYAAHGMQDADSSISSLKQIVFICDSGNAELKDREELRKLYGPNYTGIETDWEAIIVSLQKLDRYLLRDGHTVLANHIKVICGAPQIYTRVSAACEQLRTLLERTEGKLWVFSQQFKDVDFMTADLLRTAKRYSLCMNNFSALNHWLEFIEALTVCEKANLSAFTQQIVKADNSIHDVVGAFERGFYTEWISKNIEKLPAVRAFKKNVIESKIEEFNELDQAQYELAKRRIRQAIIKKFPSTTQAFPKGSQLAILTHEMGKKIRHMPLRKLFREIPDLLLTLKPCLMMSPLSVAYFLSADLYEFDMVIFDEASQIFPQDAIGAIFRGKQVVIAGDTKQMPPTNFFGKTNGGSTDYDDEDEEIEELGESILEESEIKLPTRTLQWHYRSQNEHLIAFSNRRIYQGHLVTFPGSTEKEKDTGVEFVYVENGYYESSPKNSNKVEAEKVVELIKEHIDTHPERSLGVIAFSEKQQQTITAAIQRFREKQPGSKYEEFFAEDREGEFFVKNLENVQGDERDTIIFSIGYAKTKQQIAEGKPMSLRFGPLGLAGGERRLNVAITRAKINVKLVSSIKPSDIDTSRTKSEGIMMLRSYLEFAMQGESALPSSGRELDHDEFADTIAEFIRDNGYEVVQNVGLSGYRIDIAVKHPSALVDLYAVGIECDGYSYENAKTTRDRERLRRSVLDNMGWNMYRVWSTAWFTDPNYEGMQLLNYIASAIKACDSRVQAMEAEKRRIEKIKRRAEEEKRRQIEKEQQEREDDERRKREAGLAEQRRIEEQQRRLEDARQHGLASASANNPDKDQQSIRTHSVNDRPSAGRNIGNVSSLSDRLSDEYAWIKVGAEIANKLGQTGHVTWVNNSYVSVKFGSLPEKKYKLPDAFTAGYLMKKEDLQVKHVQTEQTDHSPKSETLTDLSQLSKYAVDTGKQTARGGRTIGGEVDAFCDELRLNGFICVNDLSISPFAWVYYNAQKRVLFENIAGDFNVKWHLERHGSAATSHQMAWCILM